MIRASTSLKTEFQITSRSYKATTRESLPGQPPDNPNDGFFARLFREGPLQPFELSQVKLGC